MNFDTFVDRATGGCAPYHYQRQLAEDGLPRVLRLPPGSGKTVAAVLPWTWRRRFHPDEAVRRATPRRLVIVLPLRTLVEQTHRTITDWFESLTAAADLDWEPVGVHLLMGGESSDDRAWKMHPERDAVLVGTQDMVLSRLLMRGYGEGRAAWPVAFGLLHADTQFVFDEVQLMGPALPTSVQLDGLRAERRLGASMQCRTMWMSATVDLDRFDTPDSDGVGDVVGLSAEDEAGPLGIRLRARRTIDELRVQQPKRYAAEVAAAVVAGHRSGTRTIAIMNTVDRAVAVWRAVRDLRPEAEVVLLHSRFRPTDRAHHLAAVLADPPAGGTVAVTTQVIEAGVDISSRLLVTEAAPWSSIVQRAGRCNRAGEYADAQLLWCQPPAGHGSAAPYDAEDLAHTAAALRELSGVAVSGAQLADRGVAEKRPEFPVLRRRDLRDLFDTAPDLSGNDLDVGQWIRDASDLTISVAWRNVDAAVPEPDMPAVRRAEICPAPVAAVRDLISKGRRAWAFEQRESRWSRAVRADIRPGSLLVLEATDGGYDPQIGWAVDSTSSVEPVSADGAPLDGMASDPSTESGRAVSLAEHSEDVRREVRALLTACAPAVGHRQVEAVELAALLHDIGKAHSTFAGAVAAAAPDLGPGPWAKSGRSGRLLYDRVAFRHELVSALMLLHPDSPVLSGVAEPDLVAYLVAAHHGKVRLSARAVPGEEHGRILGVGTDEPVPAIAVDSYAIPALTLRRDVLGIGATSWTARACRLRDRADLGPFRLAFLEAIVRIADWRASAAYEQGAR